MNAAFREECVRVQDFQNPCDRVRNMIKMYIYYAIFNWIENNSLTTFPRRSYFYVVNFNGCIDIYLYLFTLSTALDVNIYIVVSCVVQLAQHPHLWTCECEDEEIDKDRHSFLFPLELARRYFAFSDK
jgi:hypothetical protein